MRDCVNLGMTGEFAVPLRLSLEPHELAAFFCDDDYFAFLDSSRTDENQGRFSMMSWSPETVLRTKGHEARIRTAGVWRRVTDDPLAVLDRLLGSRVAGRPEFAGGAIGYFGYDLFRVLESHRSLTSVDDLQLPDCCLGIYDTVLVFDHRASEWTIRGRNPADFDGRIAEVERRISRPRPASQQMNLSGSPAGPSESNMDRDRYVASIRRVLEHIAAGDIYQLNLSQRFSRPLAASPFDVFCSLRLVNPSFYGAYLNCGDHAVISSSPELFLRRCGDAIETRPIKGTRPRGDTPDADLALERELLQSEKEAAELAMIVDLERNDLGRICEYGGVDVPERRYVDRLPTLLHTAATVRGRLRADVRTTDILRATFPGGSISGCPKIRAIEIIDALEPHWRHVYTGAIGFVGFGGEMTLSIAIRTLLATADHIYYQVGAGIVADSIPEAEYEETLQKGAAIEDAIARVEALLRKTRAER